MLWLSIDTGHIEDQVIENVRRVRGQKWECTAEIVYTRKIVHPDMNYSQSHQIYIDSRRWKVPSGGFSRLAFYYEFQKEDKNRANRILDEIVKVELQVGERLDLYFKGSGIRGSGGWVRNGKEILKKIVDFYSQNSNSSKSETFKDVRLLNPNLTLLEDENLLDDAEIQQMLESLISLQEKLEPLKRWYFNGVAVDTNSPMFAKMHELANFPDEPQSPSRNEFKSFEEFDNAFMEYEENLEFHRQKRNELLSIVNSKYGYYVLQKVTLQVFYSVGTDEVNVHSSKVIKSENLWEDNYQQRWLICN